MPKETDLRIISMSMPGKAGAHLRLSRERFWPKGKELGQTLGSNSALSGQRKRWSERRQILRCLSFCSMVDTDENSVSSCSPLLVYQDLVYTACQTSGPSRWTAGQWEKSREKANWIYFLMGRQPLEGKKTSGKEDGVA